MSTAIQVSRQSIGKMHDRVQNLQRRIEKFKGHAEEMTEKFVRTVEVGAGALAVGVFQGRTGGMEVMGVPAELGAGLGLNLLGYFGAAGKHSDHLNNLGDGMLAGYLATVGRGLGAQWRAKDALPAGSATASKGTRLSPGEVAEVIRQAAAEAGVTG